MNRRIRELILQANPASKEIYESDNWEYNCAAWCAKDLAKFAELIVRECLEIVNRKEYSYHEADPLWETSEMIKEHFGVGG